MKNHTLKNDSLEFLSFLCTYFGYCCPFKLKFGSRSYYRCLLQSHVCRCLFAFEYCLHSAGTDLFQKRDWRLGDRETAVVSIDVKIDAVLLVLLIFYAVLQVLNHFLVVWTYCMGNPSQHEKWDSTLKPHSQTPILFLNSSRWKPKETFFSSPTSSFFLK